MDLQCHTKQLKRMANTSSGRQDGWQPVRITLYRIAERHARQSLMIRQSPDRL